MLVALVFIALKIVLTEFLRLLNLSLTDVYIPVTKFTILVFIAFHIFDAVVFIAFIIVLKTDLTLFHTLSQFVPTNDKNTLRTFLSVATKLSIRPLIAFQMELNTSLTPFHA